MYTWLIGPAVGSIIGYLTNDIAIRMMLRPHNEKRIFGIRIPFTPGLIPRERPRLARAIREVLDTELLAPEVLETALLSETMLERIDNAAQQTFKAIYEEQRTPRMLLTQTFGDETIATAETRIQETIKNILMEQLLASDFSQQAATIAVEEATNRIDSSTAGIARLFFTSQRRESIEGSLSNTIQEIIRTRMPALIDSLLQGMVAKGMDEPIASLQAQLEEKEGFLRTTLLQEYQKQLHVWLPPILSALDLGKIVEDRLNSLDMRTIEELIMQVMRKELRAIVWLGALLGGLIGILNTVIPQLL